MNPIENHWHELKTFLRTRVKPRTKEELVNGINKFWNDLNSARCSRYIDHLEKVFPAVVARDGAASGFETLLETAFFKATNGFFQSHTNSKENKSLHC